MMLTDPENVELHFEGAGPVEAAPPVRQIRRRPVRQIRRRIDPQSGRALEILGHAIEYLIDEHMHEDGSFSSSDGQVQAIQLLMATNRQIYYQCPEAPDLIDRCLAILCRHSK